MSNVKIIFDIDQVLIVQNAGSSTAGSSTLAERLEFGEQGFSALISEKSVSENSFISRHKVNAVNHCASGYGENFT